METMELIRARHSVRQYTEKTIPGEIRARLDEYAEELNQTAGLHIQILYDEPECFNNLLARYGRFVNCRNYISLVGKKAPDLEERSGDAGERLVLKAQELGLNTCWAALTFNKKKVRELIPDGETLCMVISLGYGETQGNTRKSKTAQDVVESGADQPWFSKGVEAALKAPTAVNQQKFIFSLKDGEPFVRVRGLGSYTKVDLGIVAYHFEAASGHKVQY